MSRSNIGNVSSDLPPSYDEVCSAAERRGSSASTSRKTESTSKSKNNETAAEVCPTAPPQDILENMQVPEPTRSEDTSIAINDIVDGSEFDAMSPATRIKRYQQIPQGPEPQNNARWHQRLRRNLSYNRSDDDEKYTKYAVFIVGGFFAIFFLVAIFCLPSTSHSNYLQSEEYLKSQRELDHLFEVNDYLSGRRDMKKDADELLDRLKNI